MNPEPYHCTKNKILCPPSSCISEPQLPNPNSSLPNPLAMPALRVPSIGHDTRPSQGSGSRRRSSRSSSSSTPNRERQCIGCWLCESPTRRSQSERQCKVVQIRVLVGDAWVRTYSFQADFKAITYQSPCDAVHALVPEESPVSMRAY